MDKLNILPGTSMQLEIINSNADIRHSVVYIGSLPGKSILVSAPMNNQLPDNIMTSTQVAIRFFSGKDIYAFKSIVSLIYSEPFNYLHLFYPEKIESVMVRQAERIPAFIEARTSLAENGEQLVSMIRNISTSGFLLVCEKTLGEVETEIFIKFTLEFAKQINELCIKGIIKNVGELQVSEGEDHAMRRYGIEFSNLDDSTEILIHGYIFEQLVKSR